MLLLIICSILILSGCKSKENDNGVVTDNITTTVVTSEEDRQYVAKIAYSAVLVNKSDETIRIIEVKPVLNELMASKVDVPTSMVVNLNVPEQAKVEIADELFYNQKALHKKKLMEKKYFLGLI
jgi:PBP1b-binding outer membrane lipoprotein LpoB